MKTFLVISVGETCAPIVTSIQTHWPDFVCFMTSEDSEGRPGSYVKVDAPGDVCEIRREQKCPHCKHIITRRETKPSIVAQTGLEPERYTIVRMPPDHLSECYTLCRRTLEELRSRDPEARLVVDYTGGTKTMSAALALAALEHSECELSLVTGMRTDLQRVVDGTELAGIVDTLSVRVQRQLTLADELFNSYNYAAAQAMLEDAVKRTALTMSLKNEITRRVPLCRGFEAWDRFDYASAYQRLRPYAGRLGKHWTQLLALVDKGSGSEYAGVYDLIRNAERCADRTRYDDAVARLYRAVELLAQRRLETRYLLKTSNIDLQQLPEKLRPQYEQRKDPEEGKIRLGLQDAYQLLTALNDPLGDIYCEIRQPLREALKLRNSSKLAHGDTPVEREGYQQFKSIVLELIERARKPLTLGPMPPQFPKLQEILQ